MNENRFVPAVYRGYGPAESEQRGQLVTVTRDGPEEPLRHVVRHSPTGLSWGFAGSGPADLALSILVDALGGHARCVPCAGNGRLAPPYDEPKADPIPYQPAFDSGAGLTVHGCWECDAGLRPMPYQQFKTDHVARWPEQGWQITQADVQTWFADLEQEEMSR